MQERSALINNKVDIDKDANGDKDEIAVDRETEFASLIADGDAAKLESFLEHHLGDETFVLGSLATEKVGQKLKGIILIKSIN